MCPEPNSEQNFFELFEKLHDDIRVAIEHETDATRRNRSQETKEHNRKIHELEEQYFKLLDQIEDTIRASEKEPIDLKDLNTQSAVLLTVTYNFLSQFKEIFPPENKVYKELYNTKQMKNLQQLMLNTKRLDSNLVLQEDVNKHSKYKHRIFHQNPSESERTLTSSRAQADAASRRSSKKSKQLSVLTVVFAVLIVTAPLAFFTKHKANKHKSKEAEAAHYRFQLDFIENKTEGVGVDHGNNKMETPLANNEEELTKQIARDRKVINDITRDLRKDFKTQSKPTPSSGL